MKIVHSVLPSKFSYGDRLTSSARRLLIRLGIGLVGILSAGLTFGLLDHDNWRDVLSGALFAWATSMIAWAVNSYRTRTDEIDRELRRTAELDLLHSRLNHLAHMLDLPTIDLQGQIESVLSARQERLAHFAGLDEFRPTGHQPGAEWWDSVALGTEGPASS